MRKPTKDKRATEASIERTMAEQLRRTEKVMAQFNKQAARLVEHSERMVDRMVEEEDRFVAEQEREIEEEIDREIGADRGANVGAQAAQGPAPTETAAGYGPALGATQAGYPPAGPAPGYGYDATPPIGPQAAAPGAAYAPAQSPWPAGTFDQMADELKRVVVKAVIDELLPILHTLEKNGAKSDPGGDAELLRQLQNRMAQRVEMRRGELGARRF